MFLCWSAVSTHLKKSSLQKTWPFRAKHLSLSCPLHSLHFRHLACHVRSSTFRMKRSRISSWQPPHLGMLAVTQRSTRHILLQPLSDVIQTFGHEVFQNSLTSSAIWKVFWSKRLIPGVQKPRPPVIRTTKFCTAVQNIFEPSVWNLLHVTLLAPRILSRATVWASAAALASFYWTFWRSISQLIFLSFPSPTLNLSKRPYDPSHLCPYMHLWRGQGWLWRQHLVQRQILYTRWWNLN